MSSSSQASINSEASNYSTKDIEKNVPTRMYSKDINEGARVSRVVTSRSITGQDVVMIGDTKVFKNELLQALGLPTDNIRLSRTQSMISTREKPKVEPAALGLCSFAATTFLLSLYNTGAMGIEVPNVVCGMAFFYGGAVQILAGMWEYAMGSSFGGLAFSSYGGFWLSYAAVLTESFGIAEAYGENTDQLNHALGFYLLTWAIFTLFLLLSVLKQSFEFCLLFFSLFITFILLAVHAFAGVTSCLTAGGVFGIITAVIAWYDAFQLIMTSRDTYFILPSFHMPKYNKYC